MDVSAWLLPAAAIAPPALVATWTVIRDRSRLARIEQIGRILSTNDDRSALTLGERSVLGAIRKRDIQTLGQKWLGSADRGSLVTAIALFVIAALFFVVLMSTHTGDVTRIAFLVFGIGWVVTFGALWLARWRRSRTNGNESVERLLNDETQSDPGVGS